MTSPSRRYLNKKSGTSGLAKDDVQEWWRMEWVDAASGWGFHWEDDERAAYRDGLFDPAESYDRIREFNMSRYLMQKVGALLRRERTIEGQKVEDRRDRV